MKKDSTTRKPKTAQDKLDRLVKGPKARTRKGFSENVRREKELGKSNKRAVGTAYGEAYLGIDELERKADATRRKKKAKPTTTKKTKEKKSKNWIQKAIKNPGALRRTLKVKEGEKIPAKKLAKALKSDNPTTRRRAQLAKTLGKMRKG